MSVKKAERISHAYTTLKDYGFDARSIDNHADLVGGFQALRAQYKGQPGGRAETYQKVLRPAFVTIANAIKNIHPRLHGDECTRIFDQTNPLT